jgi:hypothetical protein
VQCRGFLFNLFSSDAQMDRSLELEMCSCTAHVGSVRKSFDRSNFFRDVDYPCRFSSVFINPSGIPQSETTVATLLPFHSVILLTVLPFDVV